MAEDVVSYVKERWDRLTAFSKKEDLKKKFWDEICYRYSEPHRAYHNISHIAYLFNLLHSYLDHVTHPAVMGFAILYHDVVYDTYRQDNEEQSAALAETHLTELLVNQKVIDNVKAFILATKLHEVPAGYSMENDLALFLDLDMAILGTDFKTYKLYSDNIRKEYAQYPDSLYREGRKKALQKFLTTPSIYSTQDFRVVIEETARENIRKEIGML